MKTIITPLTWSGIRSIVVYVSWEEMEKLAAKIGHPGEMVSRIRPIMSSKVATLGDLLNPKFVGEEFSALSIKPQHTVPLTEAEFAQLISRSRSSLKEVRRPWIGRFESLPFRSPDGLKVVAQTEEVWREIQHEGVTYRATEEEKSDHDYEMVASRVC